VDLTQLAAVLLDMDGTLVDSDAAVERAWITWADEYHVDPAAALAVSHGAPSEATVRILRDDLDDAAVVTAAERQLALQYGDLSDVRAAPGAGELLSALEQLGLPWAVVTSADARLAALRLQAAGIVAPLLITVEDVSAGKPDPEGYRLAAAELDVSPMRCLVVEDSEPGLAAGRAAGAMTAALKGLQGDLQIAGLADLRDRLLQAAGATSH
jgi:sugar-phosphatase